MNWDIVIGLEIHVQLNTKSKLFSSASTEYGASPNIQASNIDLALPGVLPVVNLEALKMAIKFGLATNSDICRKTEFSRKNYFYPDLPKGYQISQEDKPILSNGEININIINDKFTNVQLTRAHLEEDAGQSTHENEKAGCSGINLNRAGIPLLEIVTEPVIGSAEEAVALLKATRTLVRYLNISTGNMQEGAMRCDVNISVRKTPQDPLGKRVELKNLNSFKFVEKAIQFETNRQIMLLESGEKVPQETRLYDAKNNTTKTMRTKEDALDYRYFPDPDLKPIEISQSMIDDIAKTMPELPWEKSARFIQEFNIKPSEASIICLNIDLSNFFEAVLAATKATGPTIANWICGEYLSLMKKQQLSHNNSPITVANFATMLNKLEDAIISSTGAKLVLAKLFSDPNLTVDSIIKTENLQQITDTSELEELVKTVLTNNPNQLAQYKSGKDKLFGFFVGQVMKISQGKANPQLVNSIVKKALAE